MGSTESVMSAISWPPIMAMRPWPKDLVAHPPVVPPSSAQRRVATAVGSLERPPGPAEEEDAAADFACSLARLMESMCAFCRAASSLVAPLYAVAVCGPMSPLIHVFALLSV